MFGNKCGRDATRYKVAVRGISMEMAENEIFVLLGHNGAGKSTTISMLTGKLVRITQEVITTQTHTHTDTQTNRHTDTQTHTHTHTHTQTHTHTHTHRGIQTLTERHR